MIRPSPGITAPANVMARLDSRSWSVVALAGTTYAQRATTVVGRVDQYARLSARPALIDLGGQSDLLTDMSATSLLTASEAYASERRTAGFAVLVGCTIPHMAEGMVSPTVGQEAQRVAYNALLRSSVVFDAIADLAADPRLSDASNATYFSDGLHPTLAGAAAIADVFEATLATLDIN